jgi:NADH-quinone oxidoreductase subunit D
MSVSVSTLEERISKGPESLSTKDFSTGSGIEDNDDVGTQEYFINMGPQHPATHGVLRLMLKLDGETVKETIPVLGYIHRGMEKMSEHLTYRQIVHLTDRMDYLSSLINNWCVSMTVERAMKLELNPRIETIRTIFAELERIQSHQLWWGVLGMDLGAFTPFLYGFRDREKLTDIIEETTGARLTMNYIQPGGLMFDIHPSFQKKVKEFIKYFRPVLDEYDGLLSGNVIIQERLKNVGILSSEKAISYGASGPVLRASGVAHDLRKSEPYGVYQKVNFETAIGSVGDCWDRYWVRVEEMRQSLNIVEQLMDNIPEGPFAVMKPAKKIKLPEGKFYSQVETARGILGFFIESTGKELPHRAHFRSPNFNNLWTLSEMAKNGRVGDLVANISSLDFVVPDIDR